MVTKKVGLHQFRLKVSYDYDYHVVGYGFQKIGFNTDLWYGVVWYGYLIIGLQGSHRIDKIFFHDFSMTIS